MHKWVSIIIALTVNQGSSRIRLAVYRLVVSTHNMFLSSAFAARKFTDQINTLRKTAHSTLPLANLSAIIFLAAFHSWLTSLTDISPFYLSEGELSYEDQLL